MSRYETQYEIWEEELDSNTWLSIHRDRIEKFYAKGLDFKPLHDCAACDVDNDYICFEHELQQLRESEYEQV